MIRRTTFLLWAALAAAPLGAATPDLLKDALLKVAKDKGRWAFTETDVIRNGRDKVVSSTIVRFDPSKPYAEQYTPLSINDRPPTRADYEKYRAQGESRGRGIEKAENAGRPTPGRTLGDLVDIDHATVSGEDAATITYDVPLRRSNNERFPPDKFQVLVRVNKERRALEHVSVHLRAPVRVELVLNVKAGELDADFASVDPKRSPAMTEVRGDGLLSILFVPIARNGEMTRADFKHVVPYDERFSVQIGPVKALDF